MIADSLALSRSRRGTERDGGSCGEDMSAFKPVCWRESRVAIADWCQLNCHGGNNPLELSALSNNIVRNRLLRWPELGGVPRMTDQLGRRQLRYCMAAGTVA